MWANYADKAVENRRISLTRVTEIFELLPEPLETLALCWGSKEATEQETRLNRMRNKKTRLKNTFRKQN